MSERYKNISQLSELTGLDRSTVRKRLKDVKPHKVETKQTIYDSTVALKALFNQTDEKEINEQLILEQLRYESARADKAIIEVEKLKKEVVPISEVAKTVANEYTNVRARILSIPSRCARDLSLESDPIKVKDRLDQEVNEALAELTADSIYNENEHVEQLSTTSETDSTEDTKATATT